MNYKFSVIMPVYNLEKYLEESVSSVINQSIGFRESIQLILVNDGSTDRTQEICEQYQSRYPENIICLSQENQGASAARNYGFTYATGKYVNYFDGDDIWQLHAFESAWKFLEEHNEIDVATCAQRLFEGVEGYRETYYKFKDGDRVIDIIEDPKAVELSITSAFFRKEAIEELTFDERLDYGENAKFMTLAILKRGKYGVIQSAEYLVRRRADGTSATQNHKETWQTTTLEHCHKYLYQLSINEYEKYKYYIHNVILKTLKYRVVHPVLDQDNEKQYLDLIHELVTGLEDRVICGAPYLNYSLKLYLLKLKYGEKRKKITLEDSKIYCGKRYLGNLSKRTLFIEDIDICGQQCQIRGTLRYALEEPFTLQGKINGMTIPMNVWEDEAENITSVFGDVVRQGRKLEATIPIEREVNRLSFAIKIRKESVVLTPVYVGKAKDVSETFLRAGKYMILINDEGKMVIKKYTIFRKWKLYWKNYLKT